MAQGKATVVEYMGERLTLAQLSERCGVSAATLRSRIAVYGQTIEQAVATPIRRKSTYGGRPPANVPRPVPKLKRHPSGRAYSRWRMMGKINERYFGKHGGAEANTAYRKFSQDWIEGKYDQMAGSGMKAGGGLSVAILAERWMEHVRGYYTKDGLPTTEVKTCLAAARLVNEELGMTLAADFTPAALRECRTKLVGYGHSRTTVNSYVNRVVRMFAWGAGQSLVPAAVHSALKLVESLKPGRSPAPDRPKKQPATNQQIEATIPFLAPADPVRNTKLTAMVKLQRLTGMRPGEVCALELGDLDRSADVWRYEVGKANKNRHRGKRQAYYFGPKAVEILRPFLEGDPSGPIFDEGPNNYSHAVLRASVRAGVTRWSPHQLRHALATEVAEQFRSLGHAAAAIGDSEAVASAVYVHVDPRERMKIEIARKMG
ncbi:tyrosine-type recombinase/integrase [Gemmata sp. G18]|uniref:Tyrosine-type recombinase/integrase n=1 Tax=Gemmata palustris TaxID=2822762 RepID=A0ABS5C1W7_9BACT|nr:tyrosine-type recombinase/integrase [Gemmata palustris]MBP3959450.1 tyrosine-type recombinase/integrase [Gemmata palustris]